MVIKPLFTKVVPALAVGVLLSACSATGDKVASTVESEKTAALEAQLAKLQARETKLLERESQVGSQTTRLEEQLSAAQSRVTTLESQQSVAVAPAPMIASSGDLFPPNAGPGECFARAYVNPVLKTVTEKVLKRAASERVEIIPARYETVTERVLVQEQSTRLEVIPATYRWVEERVLVKSAAQRLVKVPATYGTESEKILVKAAYTTWKKGTGPIQKINDATGEIMCLVEVPAVYKTITKRVVKTPATTRTIDEPAVYKTVKKKVVDNAATTRQVTIPAKYKTVKVTKLVTAAQEKRITIPGEYQTVTRTEKVNDGFMEWREILCETNMTRGKITTIQRALKAKGYNPGPIDGTIGWETMRAVKAFQKANKLPVDKYLNIQTVKALGVNPG